MINIYDKHIILLLRVRLAETLSRTCPRIPERRNEQHGYGGKREKSLFRKEHRTQLYVNSKHTNVNRISESRDTSERSDGSHHRSSHPNLPILLK